MSNVFTLAGANGKTIGDAQPVAGSVSGSPFTSAIGSAETPKLTGLAMIMVTTNPVHVRFDKGTGAAAVAADFLLPVNTLFMIPTDGDVMSFIQEGAAGQIYIAIAREVS